MSEPAPDAPTDLIDRWLAHHRTAPEAMAEAMAEAVAEAVAEPEPELAPEPEPAAQRPDRDAWALARPVFAPRTTARRLTGVVLLVAAGAAAYLAWQAWTTRAQTDLVLAVVAAGLTLVVHAARASTSVTRLEVVAGRLAVSRGGSTWRVELGSTATPVEVVGRPGRHGWQVRFPQRDGRAYVVDASVVDPHHFMQVLAHYRPDVVRPSPRRVRPARRRR